MMIAVLIFPTALLFIKNCEYAFDVRVFSATQQIEYCHVLRI